MDLQQVQAAVDGVDPPDLSGQQVHGTDAAMSDAVHTVGNLVFYIAGGEGRSFAAALVGLVEPSLQPPLAVAQFSSYDRIHSKSLRASGVKKCEHSSDARKTRGFRFFRQLDAKNANGFACLGPRRSKGTHLSGLA
jgi:hypothetical protein